MGTLKKELNLLNVFCIATGAMISSGLFILPGLAHIQAGPASVISYFLAGLLAMAGMLSQAELVSAMPKAGGTCFYVTRSMGPALGTIDGLLTWMSISLKSSFALIGIAAFSSLIVDTNARFIAIVLCLVFVTINLVGAKEAGIVQTGIVIVLLAFLAWYVIFGMFAVDARNFQPFMPYGISSVFYTAGFVFISYGGLLKVASIAEEVKDPARTVPLGMILSLCVACALYTLVVYVTSGVLGADQLDHSLTPLTDGAAVFMGPVGAKILTIAAILAFVSTANAGIMSASRYPLALSRDHLLPDSLGKVHSRTGVPYVAVLVTGLIIILGLFPDLTLLVEAASTVLIFTFIFSCLCVIVMRESGLQNYMPKFRCPFYPWIQVVGVFGCWLLVVSMGREAIFIGSILFACGLGVFWFYGRVRTQKDFALLHLIEKIAAKELISVSLESELKEIIRERDEIVKDRFDRIIEESIVLDIDNTMSMEDFFELVAKKIAPPLGVWEATILKLLLEREQVGSTVLSPGLAIPHIIVEGDKAFIILLARCRSGVIFPDGQKVHTIFVIAGGKKERNFHLRALSSIAQIVQDPHFGKKWMSAKEREALRDLVLLGKRKRHKKKGKK